MIDHMIIELPLLGLFLKFMIASTCLLGGVWLMEKLGIINTPDIAELAWKLAIAASFIALLPVSLSPTNITVPISETEQFRALPSSPLAAQASHNIIKPSLGYKIIKANESDSEAPALIMAPEAPSRASGTPVNASTHQATDIFTPMGTDTASENIEHGITESGYSVTTIFMIGWLVLAAIALLALIVSYQQAIKNLGNRVRVPAEHEANKALRAICETANIRHVPFLSRSDEIDSPVCLPRREICLPKWAFDDMNAAALRSLIAHELAHMLRRDPFQIIFLQTLCRICFFQPLFALARRRLEDCAELAADEWAANQLSSANAVAEALYTCAQKITQKRQIQWGLAMAGDKSILRQRVERLVHADSDKFQGASTLKRASISVLIAGGVLAVPSIEFASAMNTDAPEYIIEYSAGEPFEFAFAINGLNAIEKPEKPLLHNAPQQHSKSGSRTGSRTHISSDDDGVESGNLHWSDDDRSIKVSWEGSFELSEDESSITALSKGGELQIRTHNGNTHNRIRLEDNDGNIEITYWEQGQKKPFDKDAQEWFSETLEQLLQHTAIDMDNRVARYLKEGGTDGALNRMADIRSDYVKRMFTIEMIRQADFTEAQFKSLLRSIRSFESDYEVRLTLLEMMHAGMLTPDTLPEALEVAKTLDSDYEMRLTLSPMLETFKLDDESMNIILELAKSIDSDYELRLLLSEAASQSFSIENAEKLIAVSDSIESDYELRLLLGEIAEIEGLPEGLDEKLIAAIKSIEGDYERRLALDSIVDRDTLSRKAWLGVIEQAAAISSDREKRLILEEVQDKIPDDADIRAAWTKAAQSITSKYERRLLIGTDD